MIKLPVKIFSIFKGKRYTTLFPNIDTVAEHNVAYPFYVYDILLPVGKVEKTLNIFEETVLKMTTVTGGNTETISNSLCLSKDFIAFVQNKLKGLEFIDERYNITESGNTHLSNENETKKIEHIPVKLFSDPNRGSKLSFINVGAFEAETFDIDGKYLIFNVGTKGRTRNIRAEIDNPLEGKHPLTPTQSEIESIVRKYNKIRKNSSGHYDELHCVFTEKADISDAPELVYVHLKVAIPNGNADKIIVSDGFSADIDFLHGRMNDNRSIVAALRRRGIKDTDSERSAEVKNEKYRELYYHWNGKSGAVAVHEKIKGISTSTPDSRKEYFEKCSDLIRNIYGALEWCLYYALLERPQLPETLDMLRRSTPQTNRDRLISEAEKIGLTVSSQNIRLFEINNLGVNNYENGTPDLFSCIALFLLDDGGNSDNFQRAAKLYSQFITNTSAQSKENGSETDKHEFVSKTNNLLDFFAGLKGLRDTASHGWSDENRPQLSDLTDIYNFTLGFISTILPNFQQTNSVAANDANSSLVRNKAMYSLEEELGFEIFQSIPVTVRDALIRLEPIRENSDSERTGDYTTELSKIAEHTLLQAIREIKDSANTDETVLKVKAFDKIRACSGKDLDVTIKTVRDHFIRQALLGCNATLGAYMIAYFAYAGEEAINTVNKSCDGNFVKTVESLLKLRRHANRKFIGVKFEELETLRSNLIKIIRSI
jgi:hypothetical protein